MYIYTLCPKRNAELDMGMHLWKKAANSLGGQVVQHVLILALMLVPIGACAAENKNDRKAAIDQPFTVEYYYRIKHGYFNEWMELYKKNHWPVLIAEKEEGTILDIKVDRARNYLPESHRWSLRVTITFKNVLVPHGLVDRNKDAIVERLFPDRSLFDEEEQRRFRLLDEFMEVELVPLSTDGW